MSETDVATLEATDLPADAPIPEAEEETSDQPKRRRRKPRKDEPALDEGALEAAARELVPAIEAILISMERPLPGGQIAEALGIEDKAGVERISRAVELLNKQYEESGRSFRVEKVAGGYRMMTCPEFAWAVAAIHGVRENHKLSRAAVETLAIVAYKQPITRANIEAIRGVNAGEVLRTLLERRLVDVVGRAEELGRPMLYGTSKRFLETFGLSSLKDLPTVGEFFPEMAAAAARQTASAPSVEAEPNDEPPIADESSES